MPLEDLDLEFEDEEEKKKRLPDVVHQEVDLAFSVGDSKAQNNTGQHKVSSGEKGQQLAQVKKIDEARAKSQSQQNKTGQIAIQRNKTGQINISSQPLAQAVQTAVGVSEIAMERNSQIMQLSQLLDQTKYEAKVQVEAARQKADYAIEVFSDAKVMQHQIQQILLRINAKHPDVKNELVHIQKALAEFINKKRK